MAFTVRWGDPGSSDNEDGDDIIECPVDTTEDEHYRNEEDNAHNLDDEIFALATVRELQCIYETSLSNSCEYISITPDYTTLCRYINAHSQNETITTGCLCST